MVTLIERFEQQLDWNALPNIARWTLEQALAIQQIAAPTFHESERATYVQSQMEQLGLSQVSRDEMANVYGLIEGQQPHLPPMMLTAHTDTVFAANTPLTPRRLHDTIQGPGLGDNSVGVASLLGFARFLREQGIKPPCPIWCIATTREEGLGDLGGMKAVFVRFQGPLSGIINLEGLAFGYIYNAGIAVRRLRITARADGGHSWLHFGRPNAIHTLTNVGQQILKIQPPQTPRTTYNIGMISGGTAINALATEASMWLDLRSETLEQLEYLEAQVRRIIDIANASELQLEIEVVGDRPAGTLASTHPLVQDAIAALRQVGVQATLECGSTDANVPLALGYPAVTVGITRGGNAHRLDEYIETEPIAAGLKQLVLLTLTTAQRATGLH